MPTVISFCVMDSSNPSLFQAGRVMLLVGPDHRLYAGHTVKSIALIQDHLTSLLPSVDSIDQMEAPAGH